MCKFIWKFLIDKAIIMYILNVEVQLTSEKIVSLVTRDIHLLNDENKFLQTRNSWKNLARLTSPPRFSICLLR